MNDSIIRLRSLTVVIKHECELASDADSAKERRFARILACFASAVQSALMEWVRGAGIREELINVLDAYCDFVTQATTENAGLAILFDVYSRLIEEIING